MVIRLIRRRRPPRHWRLWPWLVALSLGACGGSGDGPDAEPQPRGSVELHAFASSTELEAFVRSAAAENRGPIVPGGIGAEPAVGAPGVPASDPAGPGSTFSGTTLQEPGVDEPDVIKTDGRFIYIAHGPDVEVVDTQAAPGSPQNVAAIPVLGRAHGLFLDGSTLVVFYEASPGQLPAGIDLAVSYVATGILFVDVTDPIRPALQRQVVLEGAFNAARLVDGLLHIVLRSGVANIAVDSGSSGGGIAGDSSGSGPSPGAEPQAPVTAAAVVAPADPLPRYFELDGTTVTASGPAVTATNVFHPAEPSYLQLVLIASFKLNALAQDFTSVAYLGDSQITYGSTTALYLTETRYNVVLPGPEPLPASDGTTRSDPPPVTTAAVIVDEWATAIHKFAFQPNRVTLAASGGVPGNLLDQHSMGEFEGRLRVATQDWRTGSNVFVLEQQAQELAIIGNIQGIEPTETLFAARFIGPRGYLVTFEQIDPLFVLDLSDPTAPRITGELEIPGFSTKLHPLDADHLLAVGNGVVDRRITGAKVSLFDVSDPARPTLQREIALPEGSFSEASYDTKAFTYWPAQGLLAIPSSEGSGVVAPATDQAFIYNNGLRIFAVDPQTGLTERGYLDMAADQYTAWTRAVFSGATVYGITEHAVIAAASANPDARTAALDLPVHNGGTTGERKPPVDIAIPSIAPSP